MDTMKFPYKDLRCPIPNNRIQAEQHASWLKKKLEKSPVLLKDYTTFVEELVAKGYARRVPQYQKESNFVGKTWFIPHHSVYHPHKPRKICVVFDCSAKYKGKSLNDLLLKGPGLTNSLLGVLTRFRQEHVAVMADIEAIFHQVKVPDTDRSFLRFLCWPNGDLSYALKEYQMSVDDCLKSFPSVQDAIAYVGDLRSLLQRRGFRLMKWISSDREVLETIPEPERAQTIKEISLKHAVE